MRLPNASCDGSVSSVAGAECKVSVAQELAISMCRSNARAIGSDTSRMTEGILAPMGPLT